MDTKCIIQFIWSIVTEPQYNFGGRLQSTNLGSPPHSFHSFRTTLPSPTAPAIPPSDMHLQPRTKSERRASIFKKSSDGNDMVLRSNVKKINLITDSDAVNYNSNVNR